MADLYSSVSRLCLGFCVSFLGAIIGIAITGDTWMKFNESAQSYMTLNQKNAFGVFLVFTSFSIGPTYLGLGLIGLSTIKKSHKPVYIALMCTVEIFLVVGILVAGTYLIDSHSYYYWYQGSAPKINTLNQVMGGCIVAIYTPMALAILYSLVCSVYEYRDDPSPVACTFRPLQPKIFLSTNLASLAAVAFSFTAIFILTLFLPPNWANTYLNVMSANAYFVSDSPYSLVHNVLLYEGSIQHYSNQTVLVDDPTPDNTTEWLPDPDWLQPMVYLKLFPDVLVYYGFITGIILVGVLGTYHLPIRRLLYRRYSMNFIPSAINIWSCGASLGEILLTTTIVVLHIYWFWFWSVGWGYRNSSVVPDDFTTLQTYARSFGEMSILSMSFLTFPITHNSVWESVFGVPIDRAIKYHRVLGTVAWIFATIHMFLFQLLWFYQGTLANNAWLTVDNLIAAGPSAITDDAQNQLHPNNFTIPLMEFAWLLSVVVLSLALLRTTYSYELFVYTHYFMLLFFTLSFLHSYQSWFYMGGGLLLYVYDKCIRFVNATRYHAANFVNFYQDAKVTRIQLPGSTFGSNGLAAGLFCWVNIPELSPLEWHPFSISSPPYMAIGKHGVVEFSCLSMGPNSWTGKLAAMAEKRAIDELTVFSNSDDYGPKQGVCSTVLINTVKPIVVALDGPYGRALDYSRRKTVVLVAGGIGVTPMLNIFAEVAARKRNPSRYGSCGCVEDIYLIWIVRDASIFSAFSHILDPVINDSDAKGVHLQVFETCSNMRTSTFVRSPTITGRRTMDDDGLELRQSSITRAGDDIELRGEDSVSSCGTGVTGLAGDRSSLPLDEERPSTVINALSSFAHQAGSPSTQNSKALLSASLGHALFQLQQGRPNLDQIFEDIRSQTSSNSGGSESVGLDGCVDVTCIVCGPLPLSKAVSDLAFKHKFDFQTEEFTM